MKLRFRLIILIGMPLLGDETLQAHYSMLLPESASGRPSQAVTILFQWGHPFEHQLANAPTPKNLTVLSPLGKATDLSKLVQEAAVLVPSGKSVRGFRFRFTPEERGDYVFILHASPIWMEEDHAFFEDTVQVVLHVQAQKGWDGSLAKGMEMTPLTRPYGLQPGMIFQARVLVDGQAVAGTLVEVEQYNAIPATVLPPDEHITRTVKTDPAGVFAASLMEPGWWGMTATRDGGKKEHDGKSYPVRQRVTLWVHVDDPKATQSPTSK